MLKKSYSIQMSYDISDAEKLQAEKALSYFNHAIRALNIASDHLNIMKTPFKDSAASTPDEIMQARAAIRRFRDKMIDNFNNFKKISFQCVNLMQMFISDTQTSKLLKSFVNSIEDLESNVNKFAELFSNLEDKSFTSNAVKNIEDIQKTCDSIKDIIDERIKKHIQSNILASNWVDAISNDLEVKINRKTPLMLDLFNERQNKLNDIVHQKETKVKI